MLLEKKTFYSDRKMDTLGRNKHICIYKKKKLTKLNEEFSNSTTIVGNVNITVSCVNVVVVCAHVCVQLCRGQRITPGVLSEHSLCYP